jgi:hypothetical protein
VAAIVEQVGLGYRRIQGGGDHWPHAFELGQTLAGLCREAHLENLTVHPPNAFVQPHQLLRKVLEQFPTQQCQAIVRIFEQGWETLPQALYPLGHDDPILTQETTTLIAERSALLDKQLSGAMQCLDVLVLDLFNGHKAHVGATHRLTDRRGIIRIILMTLAIGGDELGTDETDIVPQLAYLAGPIVGPLTRFHTDTTGGQLRHKGQQLGAGQLLAHYHMPLRIDPMQLKHIFRQIDPKYCHLHGWTPPRALLHNLTVLSSMLLEDG